MVVELCTLDFCFTSQSLGLGKTAPELAGVGLIKRKGDRGVVPDELVTPPKLCLAEEVFAASCHGISFDNFVDCSRSRRWEQLSLLRLLALELWVCGRRGSCRALSSALMSTWLCSLGFTRGHWAVYFSFVVSQLNLLLVMKPGMYLALQAWVVKDA